MSVKLSHHPGYVLLDVGRWSVDVRSFPRWGFHWASRRAHVGYLDLGYLTVGHWPA